MNSFERWYIKAEIGLNSLTKQGIEIFSQFKWNNLHSLFLRMSSIDAEKNRIGGKGCKYLCLVRI